MAKRIGAKVTELATSRVPVISKPQDVLAVIRDAIASLIDWVQG